MTILNAKDANRLETVRHYREHDTVFAPVLNRPIEDINQRTLDINRLFMPGRGMRVRATVPPSTTVYIETGVYMYEGQNYYFPQGAAPTSVTVGIAAPSCIRIDLVYFDLVTQTVQVATGTEQPESTGFQAVYNDLTPLKGQLPPNSAAVPLAYLYVGSLPDFAFKDSIALNYAGHIRDARLAPGCAIRPWASVWSGAGVLSDTPGGSAGSDEAMLRGNHRHDTNITAVAPPMMGADIPYGIGSSVYYARNDHVHEIDTETLAANFLKDGSGVGPGYSSAGTAPYKLCREDHVHPTNIGSLVPSTLSPLLAAIHGTSLEYSRRDHRHAMTGVRLTCSDVAFAWSDTMNSQSSPAFSFTPIFVYTIAVGRPTTWGGTPSPPYGGGQPMAYYSVGMAILPSTGWDPTNVYQYSTTFIKTWDSAGSVHQTAESGYYYISGYRNVTGHTEYSFDGGIQITNLGVTGITMKPTVSYMATVYSLIFGTY